jgi:hypothetical protein
MALTRDAYRDVNDLGDGLNVVEVIDAASSGTGSVGQKRIGPTEEDSRKTRCACLRERRVDLGLTQAKAPVSVLSARIEARVKLTPTP